MYKSVLALSSILGTVFLFSCFGGDNTESSENITSISSSETEYFETGKAYADSAQKVLGMNLKKALEEGDAVSALRFCNIRALNLTDGATKSPNVSLKRITDKPRNPANTANVDELQLLGEMKSQLKSGKEIGLKYFEYNGIFTSYYPIVVQPLCLQCHGIPKKEINPETAAVIAQLYPIDKAKWYHVGDLRGAWKVEFPKGD